MGPPPKKKSALRRYSFGVEAKANDAAKTPADSKLNWYIVKLTLAAGLGGLLFGYDTGIKSHL